MSWITILFYNIILNSLAGAAAFAVWYALGKVWERIGHYECLYTCLRGVLLSFLMPLSWAYLLLVSYDWQSGMVENLFPYTSAGMEKIAFGVFLLWIPGVIFGMFRYLKEKYMLGWLRRTADQVSSGAEWENFLRLKETLGLKCRIELYRGGHILSPMTAGVIRKRIYLPDREYEAQDWEMIVLHELQHIRQKDHWTKHLCILAETIFWFHPLVHLLADKLDCWGEINCDLRTCRAGKGSWSVMTYYAMILRQVDELQNDKKRLGLSLGRSGVTLKWRVMKMKNYTEKKRRNKLAGGLLAAVFFISCPLLAMASGEQMGDVYYRMVNSTLTGIEEEYIPKVYEEQYEAADPEEIIEILQVDISRASNMISMEFHGNGTKATPYVSLEAGTKARLSAFVTPEDGSVRMGVMDSRGNKRYVTITGDGVHSFSIEEDGMYRFFVENVGGEDLEVILSYSY